MSWFGGGREVARLRERLALLENRLERMHRYGTITDVDVSDATKPRARLQIGLDDQGQPVKSPWLPYATIAGGRNMHHPPSQGQQFLKISPGGEHEAGLLIPLGHSNKVPSPSTDPATDVDQRGATKTTQTDGTWKVECGPSSIAMDKNGITLTATKIVTAGETHLGSAGGVPAAQQGTVDTGGFEDVSNFASKVYVT